MGSPDDIIIGGRGELATASTANVVMLVAIFGLTTAVMAALALPLGGLFRSMPPLRAYAIDIIGSLTGIAAFTALSFVGVGPGRLDWSSLRPGRAARPCSRGITRVVARLGGRDGRLPVRDR